MSIDLVLLLNHSQELTKTGLRESCKSKFLQLALAVENFDLEVDNVESKLNALVQASGTGLPMASDSELIYHNAWVAAYKKQLPEGDAEEAYTIPEISWNQVRAPIDWMGTIGRASGYQDAQNTKAFYKYCQEHPA